MIKRDLLKLVKTMSKKMPIVSIVGPRQSGKTTLAQMAFPKYDYVNLESPDEMERALQDPREFLSQHKTGLIIDEAQRFPELFSYIQTISDKNKKPGEFIISGSQNLLLSSSISQSLAGRVFLSELLPFTLNELDKSDKRLKSADDYIYTGFYPRIYDMDIDPIYFYPSYVQTYLERDVRQITDVSNINLFQRFIKLAAGRVGQIINYSSISNELGIDQKTVKSWFSILEASYICYFVQPHFGNYTKRLIKSPKLYFYDTGLVCSLLGIRKKGDLKNHWARGSLFENLIISDVVKTYANEGVKAPVYYWRDSSGNEIDMIIDEGDGVKIYEIKSSTTFNSSFHKNFASYLSQNVNVKKAAVIYNGKVSGKQNNIELIPFENLVNGLR